MDIKPADIVLEGLCLYGEQTTYHVRIVVSDIFYGTGDFFDDPEVSDDREITTYTIWYENLCVSGVYDCGGGQFTTLSEAKSHVEKLIPSVKWQL